MVNQQIISCGAIKGDNWGINRQKGDVVRLILKGAQHGYAPTLADAPSPVTARGPGLISHTEP